MELKNFMCHADTVVELPERGVVTVQGANGSGKSSLIEAVSTALFGKTLRGSPPWSDDKGSVDVFVEGIGPVKRTRSGNKSKLTFGSTEHDTATKAQEALEYIVGDFDVWRRTSVFSSADAAHFTLATDGERKRLLESILGLDRFDDALDSCRTDLRAIDTSSLLITQATTAANIDTAKSRVASCEATLAQTATAETVEGVDRKLRAVLSQVASVRGEALAIRDVSAQGRVEVARIESEVQSAERDAARIASGQCPTCGQDTKRQHKAAAKNLGVLNAQAKDAIRQVEQLQGQHRATLLELGDEERLLEDRAKDLREQQAVAKQAAWVHNHAAKGLAEAEAEVTLGVAKLTAIEVKLTALNHEAAILSACERVLGLKGVRAQVLGKALGGIEQAANAWLGQIAGPGLRLSLNSYVEKKTGGVTDAIGLEVSGAGGGHGYKGASGGERRRIDVALLFALAEVASAAHGREVGTLWVDEAFDSLDANGRAAVAVALEEIGRSRAVVVITHEGDLAQQLAAAKHLQIEAGHVV